MIELLVTAHANARQIIFAALLAASLAGCTTTGGSADDGMGGFVVAPGKFLLFNCDQLAVRATGIVTRQKELEALMAKAGTGADGGLVSAFSYRPEYVALRGEMNELRKAAAERHCKSIPALEIEGRASDRAVR
jgi:hypothetical protein